MQKEFDRWNALKKAINAAGESARAYFHEGDIWWVRLGVNVGYEINGDARHLLGFAFVVSGKARKVY